MALGRKSSGNEELPIPLNTLIDVVFLLLVYFVITWSAPIPEAQLSVNLPSPGESTSDNKPETLRMQIQPDTLLVNGAPLSITEIQPRLKKLAGMNDTIPVIVKVSPRIRTNRLVQVLDMVKGVGFKKVNVMTLKE